MPHQTKHLSTLLLSQIGPFVCLSVALGSQLSIWAHQDFSLQIQSDHRWESGGREGSLLRTPYMPGAVLSALLSPPVLPVTRKDVVVLGP